MYEEGVDGKIEDERRFKSKIDEHIDEIYKMASMIRNGERNNLYEHSNNILGKLGSEYRKYIINYSEAVEEIPEAKLPPPLQQPPFDKESFHFEGPGPFGPCRLK